jgi:hypothetical protein
MNPEPGPPKALFDLIGGPKIGPLTAGLKLGSICLMPRRNSRKIANILQEVGRALYGDIWQSELARDLGCNDRTIRKWNAGDAPIPEYLRGEVAKICRRRGDRLIEIAEQLGATSDRAKVSRPPPAEPPSKSAKPSASKPPRPDAVSAPRPTNAPTASSGIVPSPPPPLRLVIVPPGAAMPSPSPGVKYVRG